MASNLSGVTVSIFTRSVRSPNFRRCLSSLPSGVHTIVIEGIIDLVPDNTTIETRGSRIIVDGQSVGYVKSRAFNFSRNVNLVARLAETTWVLLLNDDCFLAPFAVEEMLLTADMTGASAVSANISSLGGRLVTPKIFPGVSKLMEVHNRQPFQYVKLVFGTCLLVRKSTLRETPWDEHFPLTEGDTDFSLRLRGSGLVQARALRAKGIHLGSKSSESPSLQSWRVRGILYFWQKHPECRPSQLVLRLFYLIRVLTFPAVRVLIMYAPHLAGVLVSARSRVVSKRVWYGNE